MSAARLFRIEADELLPSQQRSLGYLQPSEIHYEPPNPISIIEFAPQMFSSPADGSFGSGSTVSADCGVFAPITGPYLLLTLDVCAHSHRA